MVPGARLDKVVCSYKLREGDKEKGRIFMDANKKTIIFNTKIHLGYGFPCEPETSRNQRLNDVKNNEKMTQKIIKPVLKAIKPQLP